MFVAVSLVVSTGIVLIFVDLASKHFLDIVQIQERVNWLTRLSVVVVSQPFPSLLFSKSFLLPVLVWDKLGSGVLIKTKIKILVVMVRLLQLREIVLRFLWTR